MGRLSVSGMSLAAALVIALPVQAQTVSAVPDSGTADAGVGSQPITNVAANDTVNGVPAVLGSGGNAVLTKASTVPAGIAFNTATGTVKTSTSAAAGTYTFTYQLCDLLSPPDCAQAGVTVNVINAAISPAPDSGTADAGIASKPIATVTANDTINGAPVVLGTNATVTKAPGAAWPAGIVFAAATGTVTTTAGLAAGSYAVQYQLCDKNSPAQCVPAAISLNVITPSIIPVPETGTSTAGKSAIPIANVAANDTVNSVPATLGTGGNATVAQVGTWQTGIVLNPATGAVTTTIAVAPGSYPIQYSLCDLNSPPDCVTTTDMVTVSAAIVTAPIAGFTTTGNAATVTANVVANDTVNNAAATLGTSGDATVTAAGSWPQGITLNTTNGAVTVDATVQPATYVLQYRLCDLSTTPDCNSGSATVYVTPVYSEQLANATPMGDVEFDWGRDGINCPTCNFGDGNARANWTERNNNPLSNLWIAHLDVTNGTFNTPGANDELVDTFSTFWNVYGNGPEWTFSTGTNGTVSQLVYSRVAPTAPANLPNPPTPYVGAAYATQTAYSNYATLGQTGWTPSFFVGAINHGATSLGTNNSNLPEGSQCNADTVPMAMYKNFASPLQLFTETLSSSGTQLLAPFTSNGIGERFVPCSATRQLTFQADVTVAGNTFQQVFWYDVDRQLVDQLTTDPTAKSSAFMFRAPDFSDNYILFTLAKTSVGTTIQVYEQMGSGAVNPDGSPTMTLVNSIVSPDPNELYMNSAEPFINCTPVCTTYIYTTLAKTANAQNGISEPNGLAVVALNPATPLFNILFTANSLPARQRLDPEYYITPQGPYLYYNRIVPQTGSTNYKNQGEWFIDLKLGAPSGSCVGSSAEDGLMPGC